MSTTIYTPIDVLNALSDYLEMCIGSHKWNGMTLKTGEGVEGSSAAELSVPHVYRFLCPPDEVVDGYPSIVPSVTVILGTVSVENNTTRVPVSLHTAVVYPSVAESEKATPTPTDGVYTIDPERDGYTRAGAQRSLYVQTMRLTQTIAAFVQASPFKITNLSIMPPEASLPDFPYCTARIDATIEQNEPTVRRINTDTEQNTFINEWL